MTGLLSTVLLASARGQVAGFLDALIQVYTLLIIAYVLVSLVQSAGMAIPYNRVTSTIIGFLNDAVEPFLALFRRILPPLGPLDLSPLVAIIALQFVGRLVVGLVQG